MSIEMPPAEVHALADRVCSAAAVAEEMAARLQRPGNVGESLQPGVEQFLECQRLLGQALAGELGWLAGTVAAVADSWMALDRGLLASRGRAGAE